jgi:hypothetical protein
VLQKEDNETDSQTKPAWTVPNYLSPNTCAYKGERDGHGAEEQTLLNKHVGKTGHCNEFT